MGYRLFDYKDIPRQHNNHKYRAKVVVATHIYL